MHFLRVCLFCFEHVFLFLPVVSCLRNATLRRKDYDDLPVISMSENYILLLFFRYGKLTEFFRIFGFSAALLFEHREEFLSVFNFSNTPEYSMVCVVEHSFPLRACACTCGLLRRIRLRLWRRARVSAGRRFVVSCVPALAAVGRRRRPRVRFCLVPRCFRRGCILLLFSEERQYVVLAERMELDVFDNHHP